MRIHATSTSDAASLRRVLATTALATAAFATLITAKAVPALSHAWADAGVTVASKARPA